MVSIVGRPMRIAYNRSVAPICPNPLSAAAVRRAIVRFAPDVVHVHEPFSPSTSMLAVLASKAPVVATFHACADSFFLYRAMAPLLRVVERRCDRMLAVSEAAATLVMRDLGIAADVVPNGVDTRVFRDAEPAALPEGPKLLFVGRLERRKGLSVLGQAFTSLVSRIPRIQLLVVGSGPERSAIDRLPDRVRERITMLGALSDDQLPRYYAAVDAFVGPATGQESFGIVLLEAMAAGLPIVASDLPGYRAVVRDGVEGILVPVGDAERLAEALEHVLTNTEAAARLGANGRVRAEEFSWQTIAAGIESTYDAVVSQAGSRTTLEVGRPYVVDSPSPIGHRTAEPPRPAAGASRHSSSRVRNRAAM